MDNKAAYRHFCTQVPDLPIYVYDWYLDAVCVDCSWDVAIAKNGDQVVGALPYMIMQKALFRYITMPQFVKFMGPILHPNYRAHKHEVAIYQQLIEQLPKVHGFKQNFHYTAQNWLPFYWQGYQQTTRYSYRIELNDLDTIFGNINRNMRRNIKKAQQNVKVSQEGTPETFYAINKKSFARQGLTVPYAFELFCQHDASLVANDARALFFARDAQGHLHSAAHLIWDREASYYHLSGDDPELRDSGSGILLIWEAIKYSKEVLGLKYFDFEGSMLPQVEQIRRQFGAQQKPYFFIWKYNSRLFQALDYWRGNAPR
jgi:lipid II:glycine glycyltransferase (peptidoglycan interpeptide bridge formation enzyme)